MPEWLSRLSLQTLGFSWGHDLRVEGLSLEWGSALRVCLQFSLCPSPCAHTLSLLQIN